MCRGFLWCKFWRILPGILLEDCSLKFSNKNEEKKSGDKIREKKLFLLKPALRVTTLVQVRLAEQPAKGCHPFVRQGFGREQRLQSAAQV